MSTIHERIAEAQVECAKYALLFPGSTPEGAELIDARRNFEVAKRRLAAAQALWNERIAPAKDWAPDPLKEQHHG